MPTCTPASGCRSRAEGADEDEDTLFASHAVHRTRQHLPLFESGQHNLCTYGFCHPGLARCELMQSCY